MACRVPGGWGQVGQLVVTRQCTGRAHGLVWTSLDTRSLAVAFLVLPTAALAWHPALGKANKHKGSSQRQGLSDLTPCWPCLGFAIHSGRRGHVIDLHGAATTPES